MATETKIPNIETSWEGYTGERVEEFIKERLTHAEDSKVGYLKVSEAPEPDGFRHLRAFSNQESYTQWLSDQSTYAENVLSDELLPADGGGSSEASYVLKLMNMGEKYITATNKADLIAHLRFTSQLYDPSDGSMSDTNEDGVLTIQTRMQGAAEWKTAGTVAIMSQEAGNPSDSFVVDLSPYISDGTQSVRMIVIGNTSEKKTQYVNMTVTLTNISIRFNVKWQTPFEYKSVMPAISVPAYVTGTINKVLHYKVTGETDTSYNKTYEYALGTTVYSETPYSAVIEHPKQQGVYLIEAWVSSGETVRTESVTLRIMCATAGDNTPLLVLNNISRIQNWSNVKAFDYALYNPNSASTDIRFDFVRVEDNQSIYAETVTGVKSGESPRTLQFDLEYETDDTQDFPVLVKFSTPDGKSLRSDLRLVVDNSENFAPTSGADFFLNPKSRSNGEANKYAIVNAASGMEVKSTVTGMTYISDGWIVDSNTGVRCLRILDGSSVSIDYDAYSDDTPLQGLTIEVDFAARNVTNENGHLLDMNTVSAVDGQALGLWVMAQESCFMTAQQRTPSFQNWTYQKDKRTHVVVNIAPNLYGQGVNYVRVFINGIISREFVYEDSDSFWQAVGGVKKTGGIRIAPQGADLDLYTLRIYKKALSATDIRQNYLSVLKTVEEKKKFKSANDILGESGLISYAKCYEMYNTLLYKGKVPSLKSQAATVGDVVIHKIGDPAHSGTLYSMTRKGQGSTSKKYWAWNVQSDFKEDASKWVDETGVDHGKCYQNAAGLPYATKLVDKRNWASSMQSHKMGATRMYNDLYQDVVGKNEITRITGKENCRVAVYEDPFLVFEQENDDTDPVFIGMGTFGSGKADKPTFGYDKGLSKDMLMIEGSDNNPRLTKHQVPWISQDVAYDADEEGFVYAGTTSWDYDMGNLDTISRFIEAFNFVFLHSDRLKPYLGTLTQMKADKTLDVSYCYWVTRAEAGSALYDLYRWEEVTGTWVAAGITKNEDGSYATLNVKAQMKSYLPPGFTNHENYMEWEKVNDDFIEARTRAFSEQAGDYFDKQDIMFSMQMMKLIAGTDNRAKNTYLWTFSPTSKIRAFQDDLDSILPNDNQGQNTKPYWVEEHDYDETLGKNYWNGEDNVLYNLFERCFAEELRAMMRSILEAMEKRSGTVLQFWEDYFFSICQYFPAVAYNEFARIGYEYAHYQMQLGNYSNDTDPITQSQGSQEEGERQFCIDRTVYLSSYACYGEFAQNPSSGNINYRSTEQMTVHFDLTPAMWMYPVVTVGQSLRLMGKRVRAGESVSVDVQTDSNTQNIVCGVDYMSDIGSWYDKPANGVFVFNGKRIKELTAGTDTTSAIHLKATGVSVNTLASLRTLDLHNLSTLQGLVDLSKLSRLEQVDLRSTKVTSVSLPSQEFLSVVRLPETLTSLRLDGQYGLENVDVAGYGYLQTFYLNEATTKIDGHTLLGTLMSQASMLHDVAFHGVNWQDVTSAELTWLLEREAKVTGTLTMVTGAQVTATQKMSMVGLWGDVDSETNALRVIYDKVSITRAILSGKQYLGSEGRYLLSLKTTPAGGNDITGITWSMTTNQFATIDPKTGVISVTNTGSRENDDKATVKAVIALTGGNTVEATREVYFYTYEVQLGDYLFSDGSFGSSLLDSEKSPVGVCFYIEPKERKNALFVALSDVASGVMWGLYNGSGSNGITGITLNDSADNVYNIQSIQDILNGQSISDSTMLDATAVDNDGFKKYSTTNTLGDIGFETVTEKMYLIELGEYLDRVGLTTGDSISVGQLKTLRIMKHRDMILTDSAVNLPVPQASKDTSELDSLKSCIKAIQSSHADKYQQYYYPAGSYCFAYEPKVTSGETLDQRLTAGHWHLPSAGELSRISFYVRHGYTHGDAYAIFSGAYEDSKLTDFTSNRWYWTASEYDGTAAWQVVPRDGSADGHYGYKSYGNAVRPVVAFRVKP